MASDEKGCERRQPSSFSLTLRSPGRKRPSIVGPPTPPPACEESIHYPVFNPQDPRHNPTGIKSTWSRDGYYLSHAAESQNSIRWVQSLPRRSLRKARSGILALRSGMQRRPLSHDQTLHRSIPSIWSSSDSGEGSLDQKVNRPSSPISNASTEEDFDFGFDLHRTNCNYDSGTLEKYFLDSPSFITLADTAFHTGLAIETYSPNNLVPQRLVNNRRQCNARGPEAPGKSPQKQSIKQEKQTIYNETPNWFPSTSPSTNLRRSSIPQITGIELKMEPFQMFDRTGLDSGQNNNVNHRIHRPPIRLSETSRDPELDGVTGSGFNAGERQIPVPGEQVLNADLVEKIADTQQEGGVGTSLPQFEDMAHTLASIFGPPVREHDDTDRQDSCSTHTKYPSEDETATDVSPVSTDPWPPVVDEDFIPRPSFRDEYFLIDKSGDFRPDRGDNPIMTERKFLSDGSLHSGPGLDRNFSISSQNIPEIIGPGGFSQRHMSRPGNRPRIEQDGSDSTDECIATYPVFERCHYS